MMRSGEQRCARPVHSASVLNCCAGWESVLCFAATTIAASRGFDVIPHGSVRWKQSLSVCAEFLGIHRKLTENFRFRYSERVW